MKQKKKDTTFESFITIPALLLVSTTFKSGISANSRAVCVIIAGFLFILANIISSRVFLKKHLSTKGMRIGFIFSNFFAMACFLFLLLVVSPMFFDKNLFLSIMSMICAFAIIFALPNMFIFGKIARDAQEKADAEYWAAMEEKATNRRQKKKAK